MATFSKRSNKWHVRIQRRGYPTKSKTFLNRQDAEKWARAVEREIDLGEYIPAPQDNSTTIGDILRRYRAEVSPTKRGGIMEAIRLSAMERRSIAKHTLKSLSTKAIATYRDERLAQVSPATVNRDLDDLSAVLNHARRDWGLPVKNLVSEIRRPPRGNGRNRVLLLEEEVKLLAQLDGGRDDNGRFISGTRNQLIKPIVIFALETAMRRGEILLLRWEHINFTKRTALLPMTKNGHSRTVPLSSKAIAVLEGISKQEVIHSYESLFT